jgi:hypothetical protein
MLRNHKKIGRVLKRALLKMKARRWVHDFGFYGWSCGYVYWNTDLQKKHVLRVERTLREFGYATDILANCIKFNAYSWPSNTKLLWYNDVIKLNLRRLHEPKIRVKKA